jgi:hypothetical protein
MPPGEQFTISLITLAMSSDSAPTIRHTIVYLPEEIKERYIWDVEIPLEDSRGNKYSKSAVALLDTQSQGVNGNWITYELLKRLNKLELVSASWSSQPPSVETGSGVMQAFGSIRIEMKRSEGLKYFDVDFYVCPPHRDGRAYEIILGQEFLNTHGVLSVNRNALLPLLVAQPNLPPGKYAVVGQRLAKLLTITCRTRKGHCCDRGTTSARTGSARGKASLKG